MATGPLEHATELVERPKRMGFAAFLRHASQRIRHYANAPQPPPDRADKWERIFYGAAHPLLGFKLILRDPELLKDALVPAFWLFAFCSLVALVSTDGVYTGKRQWLEHLRQMAPFLRSMLPNDADAGLWIARVKTFYKTFALLAAAPSVVFANHYARLAALMRWRLGLGACGPRELPWSTLIKRVIEQAILVAVTLLPVTWALHILPFGGHLSNVLLGAWGLHWVVVEAFDDARVLKPGETVEQAERAAEYAPKPWFVRAFQWLGMRFPKPDSLPARVSFKFANFIDRLSKPWREEIALLEKHGLRARHRHAARDADPQLHLPARDHRGRHAPARAPGGGGGARSGRRRSGREGAAEGHAGRAVRHAGSAAAGWTGPAAAAEAVRSRALAARF